MSRNEKSVLDGSYSSNDDSVEQEPTSEEIATAAKRKRLLAELAQLENVGNRTHKKLRRNEGRKEGNSGFRISNVRDSAESQSVTTAPVNTVVTTNSNNGSGSNITPLTDSTTKRYVKYNESVGVMDSIVDVRNNATKTAKMYGWPKFKLLTDDDYHPGSKFAKLLMRKSGRDPEDKESVIWWTDVRRSVGKSMQCCRSGATQSLKATFQGEFVIVWIVLSFK
jgi:hypothetical protein